MFAEEKVNSSWSTNPVKEVTRTILQHIFFPTPTPPTLHFSSETSPPIINHPAPTDSFRNVTKAVEVGAHSDSASSRLERRSAGRGQAEPLGAASGEPLVEDQLGKNKEFFGGKMGKYDKFEDICVF